MPAHISPHPCCPGAGLALDVTKSWPALQQSRGRKEDDSLYDMTFGLDIPLANKTKTKLQELDSRDDVFVIIAHDSTVRDGVPHFPADLNDWKAQGWGRDLQWAFLRDLEHYWASDAAG